MIVLDSQDDVHLVESGMSNALPNLADLPPDVQAYIAAQTAALAAERTAHSLANPEPRHYHRGSAPAAGRAQETPLWVALGKMPMQVTMTPIGQDG